MNARWETYEEIQAASAAAGFPVSSHQLRRWRGMGLLPDVRQYGKGRSTGGSETRHPLGTAAQVIAISQFLAEKEKLTGLGWKLWLQGFPVREDHWRDPLETAQASLRSLSDLVRDADVRDVRRGGAQTIYDLADLTPLVGTPIYAPIMRLPPPLRSTVVRVAADILLGRFKADGQSGKPSDPEEAGAIETVVGLSANLPKISGMSLDVSGLPDVLEKLSRSVNGLCRKSISIEEPSIAVRRDFMNAQMVAIDLYHSTAWLFKGGFNLRTAERILAKSTLANQALMLLIWSCFVADAPEIESSAAIAEMASGAAVIRELAGQLQLAISGLPKGHPMAKPAKLRRAISNPSFVSKLANSNI